jgi:hypothetical protein
LELSEVQKEKKPKVNQRQVKRDGSKSSPGKMAVLEPMQAA